VAKRQLELTSDQYSINTAKIPNMFSPTNPLTLNHNIRYAEDLNLLHSNPDDVSPDDMAYTDEQIQLAVETNFPKTNESLSQTSSNPCTSRQQDEIERVSDEDLLEKNSDLLSGIPPFSFDPNSENLMFDDLFNQN